MPNERMKAPYLYFKRAHIEIWHGDCREFAPPSDVGCLVYDPPWDSDEACAWDPPDAPSILALCDGKWAKRTLLRFGAERLAWIFTWDTMAPWQTGPRRPLQQTKHCLWFGDVGTYQRDATLWGDAPAPKNHPSTKSAPLAGRRLVDLHRASLRWLHHPTAGRRAGEGAGVERFTSRAGAAPQRHAKPPDWIRCLVGNCSRGLVFDPFAGSGTSLRAALDLGRPAVGVEIDEATCEAAARSLEAPIATSQRAPDAIGDPLTEGDIYPLFGLKSSKK